MSDANDTSQQAFVRVLEYLISQLETANSIGADAMGSLVASMHTLSDRLTAAGVVKPRSQQEGVFDDEINSILITAQFFDRQTQQIQHTQKALMKLVELFDASTRAWPNDKGIERVIDDIRDFCFMPEETRLYHELLDRTAGKRNSVVEPEVSPGDVEFFTLPKTTGS